MLRLASLATLALASSLVLLACNPATIAHGDGGGGGTSSSTSSGGGGQSPTNACTAAGGTCVGVTPDACADGTWGDPTTCGSGVGVGCCLPKTTTACAQAGGTCVAIVPDACANGTWGDPTTCGSGAGVGCCLPAPTCDVTCNTEGAKRCIAGSVETCATNPMTNCAPVWGSAVPCAANEQCSSDGTTCVPVATTCSSNADCGCGCGCVSGTCECTGGFPPTCTNDSDCGPDCSGSKCISGTCQTPACQPGADQTCNESAGMSGLAGKCNADATCTCNAGYSKKPSGKCG